MPMIRRCLLAFAAAFLTAPALAAQDAPPKALEASGSVGASQSAGNQNATNFALGNKLKHTGPAWLLSQDFSLFYGEAADSVIASFASGGLRAERTFRSWIGTYTLVRFDRNALQGIARRFEEGIGFDFKPIATDDQKLSLQVGASFFQQSFTEGSSSSLDANYAAVRTGLDYQLKLRGTSLFQQTAEYIPNLSDPDGYLANSETSLVAPLSARFGVKVSYVLRYNNAPPVRNSVQLERLDRFFSTALTFAY